MKSEHSLLALGRKAVNMAPCSGVHRENSGICPIALFLAFAFIDGVFESRLNSPEDLMKRNVPEGKESLKIQSKQLASREYLFRQYNADRFLKNHQRAPDGISTEEIRRTKIGTNGERNHVLGYGESKVYQAYIPPTTTLDIQSACRERPDQTNLIKKNNWYGLKARYPSTDYAAQI
ncbi:hypothetical protein L873DRAFT_1845454 [Choiromyces venosus 120613-1]|uniref:Uncharacterized protein n=1 Tax=Choiromyces venosus 120613-1 TaxID=1336337 RepID=A0A3N4JDM6_9PEZI|nr:hypothetical protein L873DRAFT_1845454 [Choiromyces venosus 120613-1]